MEYRRFGSTVVLRLDKGDELILSVMKVVENEKIKLASVTGIGATDNVTVGIFDVDKKVYNKYLFTGTHEITSLVGNINTMNDKPYSHFHITLAGEGGSIVGGHLLECNVSLTAEIFINIVNGRVDRAHNVDLGINRFSF